ncbi:hypothetical protein [Tateyamaria sp.]|uniref:hypothetical protein n=1 Tax=Tateyamaria sp. TaxID=1929288 RepID=UPI003B2249C7
MHAARIGKSVRLQRVQALLRDGVERSTLDITLGARVCAVNSCIAELRANGAEIACRQTTDPTTRARVWLYRMKRAAVAARDKNTVDKNTVQKKHEAT